MQTNSYIDMMYTSIIKSSFNLKRTHLKYVSFIIFNRYSMVLNAAISKSHKFQIIYSQRCRIFTTKRFDTRANNHP